MIDPRLILTGLVLLAAAALIVFAVIRRSRVAGRTAREPETPAEPKQMEETTAPAGPEAVTLGTTGGGTASVLMRGALLFLALVVATGFVIVVLPQKTIDWMAGALSARVRREPAPETIAFLYLGDQIERGEFHIRGVIRNITVEPIEQLDVTIRLYAPGGQLVETRTVRMDSELIAPDQTAQFHLVCPDYGGQFGSYSIEFVMRQGEVVPYKDMRGTRGRD